MFRSLSSFTAGCMATVILSGCGGSMVPSESRVSPNTSIGPSVARSHIVRKATSFWGLVVDDATATPLVNEPVSVYPWTQGCVTLSGGLTASCPAALYSTVTSTSGQFSFSKVPNGDYLLVIGSNSPSDFTRATVHDHIKLTGGSYQQKAPVLPSIPYMKPRPASELSGDYRLLLLNAGQASCLQGWQQWRASQSVPPSVGDEWLFENSRDVFAWLAHRLYSTPATMLTSGETQGDVDGPCSNVISALAVPTAQWQPSFGVFDWFTDPRTLWFGAYYVQTAKCCHQFFEEYPIDPRSYPDPNPSSVSPWP